MRHGKARRDNIGQDKARHYKKQVDNTRQYKTRQYKTRQYKTTQHDTRESNTI